MRGKPSEKHIEWADMEIGVIIHYLMEIYNPGFKEYKTAAVRTELSPDRFNPDKLDPEQWVRSAYELGAKYAVLVVNHCTGFSLWQTEVNDYSCASMAWKNGKGDILDEFIAACKKYGLRPGVYYSTGCNGYYNINDEWQWDYKSEEYQSFVKCVERQVTELWSRYGEMFEIWFDGGVVPVDRGGPDIFNLLAKYQPGAITFQGPAGAPHNIRWVGNELGFAPEECWATTEYGCENMSGSPEGSEWIPAETDFPNRSTKAFGGGWAWREGEEELVYTPEHLLDCYVKSVGRNTNMLLGMAIAADGSFQDEEQFIAFGKLLKKTFGTPLACEENINSAEVTLKSDGKTKLNYLTLCEDITDGHNILAFSVYADGKKINSGECVGHKRIIPLGGITAENIKAVIDKSYSDPKFKSVSLY